MFPNTEKKYVKHEVECFIWYSITEKYYIKHEKYFILHPNTYKSYN